MSANALLLGSRGTFKVSTFGHSIEATESRSVLGRTPNSLEDDGGRCRRVWTRTAILVLHLRFVGAPVSERDDRLTQGEPSIGQRVGPGVVPKGEAGQDAGFL